MARVPFLAGCLLAAACSAPAAAQDADPADTSIVVEGERQKLRTEIRRLLQFDEAQLARFEEDFCPMVIGFDAEWTPILENLIAANAREAGLEVEKRPCKPTAVVIFAYDPEILMPALRQKHNYLFTGMNPVELDRLTGAKRATYGWRTVDMRDRFGQYISSNLDTVPTVRNAAASRLYSNVRFDIAQSFLVVDLAKVPGMTLKQLADFATLNLMLDLDLDARSEARGDSILRLFDEGEPAAKPPTMSAFERSLLRGFYGQRENNLTAVRQIGRIATAIKKADEAED